MSDYSKVAMITAVITAIVVGPLTYCGVTSAQASESSTAMKAVDSIPPALLKSSTPSVAGPAHHPAQGERSPRSLAI